METSSSSSSLVSKAKTAFHSAAAKAEKVLADLKTTDHREEIEEQSHKTTFKVPSELVSPCDKSPEECNNDFTHPRWKPATIGRKHDWQERLRNIRRGKKEIEEKEKEKVEEKEKAFNLISEFLDGDEDTSQIDLLYVSEVKSSERDSQDKNEELNALNMGTIPPTPIIKQLAVAIEPGKKFNSIKDLLVSSRNSSPVRERGALTFSAMKSLVLREKEDKVMSDFSDDDEFLPLSRSLFDPEGHFSRWKNSSSSAAASLPREIHGAPPGSIVVGLSEIIRSFKRLRKMALFWCRIITELRRLWSEGKPVPHVPLDGNPDLHSCLLQVINCCISRKRRRAMASASLHTIMREAGPNNEGSSVSPGPLSSSSARYARVSSGDLVLRLGADHLSENLTMLETDEPVYAH